MSLRQPLSVHVRQKLLEFISNSLKVQQADNGNITISTPFTYPYDDPVILHMKLSSGRTFTISDNGDTMYWLNEVNGFDPDRKLAVEDRTFWDVNCELYGTRRNNCDHLEIDVEIDNIGTAAFNPNPPKI